MAEGLSQESKYAIVRRTNPDYRDFIRQYLNFSDHYSCKECLEYGMKTNQNDRYLEYCERYFKDKHGLTLLTAGILRTRASELKYSSELQSVLYDYVIQGKIYDEKGCNQAWQKWVDTRRKEHELRRQKIYKESEGMCQTFFQP
jgi:hypothetical protein